MKLSDQAKSLLAGQYVLGTLRGGARRRLATMAKSDAQLQALMDQYAQGLQPLADRLTPVAPPARVWSAIEAKLDGKISTTTPNPNTNKPSGAQPLESIAGIRVSGTVAGWWRWLGLGASGMAATLLAVNLLRVTQPTAPTITPTAPNIALTAEQIASNNRAIFTRMAGNWDTWSVLNSADGAAQIIVCGTTSSKHIWVMQLQPQKLQPNTALELWSIPGKGQAPQSLGVIADASLMRGQSGAKTAVRQISLPASVAQRLGGQAALAVSVEPPGGSATGAPTGAVILQGALVLNS